MTAPDAAGIEAALVAGLAAHPRGAASVSGAVVECDCGERIEVSDGDTGRAFRAHQTAALLPVVTQAQAEAWDKGFKQGGPMHDVNYDDPDAHTRNPYRARADESGAR
jgi:hypothetical protein